MCGRRDVSTKDTTKESFEPNFGSTPDLSNISSDDLLEELEEEIEESVKESEEVECGEPA